MRKTEQLNTRLTAEELAAARMASKEERQNLSEWLRAILRADLRQRGLWPPQGGAPAGGAKC